MLKGISLGFAWLLAVVPAWFESQASDNHCYCNCTRVLESNAGSWKWEFIRAAFFIFLGLLIGSYQVVSRLIGIAWKLGREGFSTIRNERSGESNT